jgi:hypothetical protein
MAVIETYIQGPPNSTGEKIDVTAVTNGAGVVVDRESGVIADPETAAARAAVKNSDALADDYGLVAHVPLSVEARHFEEQRLVDGYNAAYATAMKREKPSYLDRRGSVGRGSTR